MENNGNKEGSRRVSPPLLYIIIRIIRDCVCTRYKNEEQDWKNNKKTTKKSTLFSRQSIIAVAAAVGPKLPPGASGARVRASYSFTGHGTAAAAADRVSPPPPPPPIAYGKAAREETKKKKADRANRAYARAASGRVRSACVCSTDVRARLNGTSFFHSYVTRRRRRWWW